MAGILKGSTSSRLVVVAGSVAIALSVGVPRAFAAGYNDVDEGDWCYQSVMWATEQGVMSGYGTAGEVFGPDDQLTREQAASVLCRWFGGSSSVDAALTFSDVDADNWYASSVGWVLSNGLMTGYSGTDLFGVGDPLTREQLAVVMARACGADLGSVDYAAFGSLPDAGQTSPWAQAGVAWAVDEGIINGVGQADGSRLLEPQGVVTRAQMAAIMMNAVQSGALVRPDGVKAGDAGSLDSVKEGFRRRLSQIALDLASDPRQSGPMSGLAEASSEAVDKYEALADDVIDFLESNVLSADEATSLREEQTAWKEGAEAAAHEAYFKDCAGGYMRSLNALGTLMNAYEERIRVLIDRIP